MIEFQHDTIYNGYIDIINNEGRIDEVIKICDYYHYEFSSTTQAFNWGMTFGIHIGKLAESKPVYVFEVEEEKLVLYFIGTNEEISNKIMKIL